MCVLWTHKLPLNRANSPGIAFKGSPAAVLSSPALNERFIPLAGKVVQVGKVHKSDKNRYLYMLDLRSYLDAMPYSDNPKGAKQRVMTIITTWKCYCRHGCM